MNLTDRHQLPEEFRNRIKMQFDDADEFLKHIDDEPFYSFRVNAAKGGADVSGLRKVLWCDDAYYLDRRPVYTLNPMFHAGALYPQEASSMFLWQVLLRIREFLPENPCVLDLCAAPGGKSTVITAFLAGKGIVVSNEMVRNRAWILRENIVKWGFANNIVTNLSPSKFGDEGQLFDVLVVDAPCSGEGMFRKDNVAIDEWSVRNAAMCAERQRKILDDAWDCLNEGGILIYSTCTFNPDENERNMEWLAAEHDVEFVEVETKPEWNIATVAFAGGCGYAFYPHKVEGEGFFICAARKMHGSKPRKIKQKNTSTKQPSWSADVLKNAAGFVLRWQTEDAVTAMPAAVSERMTMLSQVFPTLHCGVPMGRVTRKEFIPDAALALSVHFRKESFEEIELQEKQALKFLKGEWDSTLQTAQAGWNVAAYNGLSLGWVKSVGNRINNYYPKEWRIRMQI